jgi:hypothetical protein
MKKLRATKEENENTIKALKERLTNSENLLETKVTRLKEVEAAFKKQSGMWTFDVLYLL